VLWAMFPAASEPPAAYFEDDEKAAELGNSFVRKPLFSREVRMSRIVVGGRAIDQDAGRTARKDSSASGRDLAALCRTTTWRSAPGSRAASPAVSRRREDSSQLPRIPRDSCPTLLLGEAFPHCTTQTRRNHVCSAPDHEFPAKIRFRRAFVRSGSAGYTGSTVAAAARQAADQQPHPAPKPDRVSFTALASRATDRSFADCARHQRRSERSRAAQHAFALPFALVQPVLGPVGDTGRQGARE